MILSPVINQRNYTIRSTVKIIVIILIGSVFVYKLDNQLSRTVYFTAICLFFLFSRDNVLGIALLFILACNPFGLFYYRPYDWVFQITSTVGISYKTLFGVIVLIKSIVDVSWRRGQTHNYLKRYFIPFGFYILFLIIWGLIYGHSSASLFELFISLPVFLLFMFLPGLFDDRQIILFNRIIFLFVILQTFISFFDILTYGTVTKFLIFNTKASTASIWSMDLIRLTGGIGLALYSMVISLYYLARQKRDFQPWYLWIVGLTSLLYILNSATRGWMIASLFMITGYLVLYSKTLVLRRKTVSGIIVVVILGFILIPDSIKLNLKSAFDRFSSVREITEGDMSAGGTAMRWEDRGPKVLTRFKESPVFGFGYSKITTQYFDDHVGNHALLLIGGIFGLALVWGSVISLVMFLFRIEGKGSPFKGIFVFGLGLIGILVIHSTSRTMVSFQMAEDSAFLLVLFFNQINVQINQFRL